MSTALTIKQVFVPASKEKIKCPYSMAPQYVTIHNTANDASAMSEISYMAGNSNQTSFHYAVDDTRAVQGVHLNRNAWHAGDGLNGKGNRRGIAVEICYSKSGGDRFVKAQQNAALLTAKLLKKFGWGIDRVKRHQDFSGKHCPHRTMDQYGWDYFLGLVKKYKTELDKPTTTAAASVKIEDAQSRASGYSGGKKYKVTSSDGLNVRTGAGTNKTKIKTLAYGATVTWYGYYTVVSGIKWYLVAASGVTGYVSSAYLKAI